jgi:hypothetical protein
MSTIVCKEINYFTTHHFYSCHFNLVIRGREVTDPPLKIKKIDELNNILRHSKNLGNRMVHRTT